MMKKPIYHGSSNPNLKVIKANKSTHNVECIYGAEDKITALLFANSGQKDLDTRISNVSGKVELVERRRGILKKLYNREGYLYELDGSSFQHYDYLWSLEVVSFEKELKPLRKITYPNILEEIEKEACKGNLILYRYPNRPSDMPLDNSDLIEKYIAFEEQGLKGAIQKLLNVYPEFQEKVRDKITQKK